MRGVLESALAMEGTALKLRGLRKLRGLTLAELGWLAAVSESQLSRAERGLGNLSPSAKLRVARALRVPPEDLWPSPEVPANV